MKKLIVLTLSLFVSAMAISHGQKAGSKTTDSAHQKVDRSTILVVVDGKRASTDFAERFQVDEFATVDVLTGQDAKAYGSQWNKVIVATLTTEARLRITDLDLIVEDSTIYFVNRINVSAEDYRKWSESVKEKDRIVVTENGDHVRLSYGDHVRTMVSAGKKREVTRDDIDILKHAELMPKFKHGPREGLDGFARWVAATVKYPSELVARKVPGYVRVGFVVDIDGSVSVQEIAESWHPAFSQAAITAIKKSPKWLPGYQRGKPAKTKFIIPVSFAGPSTTKI